MKANFETGLKYCPSCKQELSIDHFNKDSSKSDKLCIYCRDCNHKRNTSKEGRERLKNIRHRYYNTEKGKQCQRRQTKKRFENEDLRKRMNERSKKWYKENKFSPFRKNGRKIEINDLGEEVLNCTSCKKKLLISNFFKDKTSRCGYDCWCKDCRKKYQIKRIQTEEFKEFNRRYMKSYCKSEKGKEYQSKLYKRRYSTDLTYKLLKLLRNRLWKFLKGCEKSDRTMNLIGCSLEDLQKHLENQFVEEMTWDNYGVKWDVDHIIPCSYFDPRKEENQRICFNFRNLQPLLKEENRWVKRDKIPEDTEKIIKTIKENL